MIWIIYWSFLQIKCMVSIRSHTWDFTHTFPGQNSNLILHLS